VFGAVRGQSCYHIKLETPVDMTDIWTTERMDVSVKPCGCEAGKLSQIEREEERIDNQLSLEKGPTSVTQRQVSSNEEIRGNRTLAVEESRTRRCL